MVCWTGRENVELLDLKCAFYVGKHSRSSHGHCRMSTPPVFSSSLPDGFSNTPPEPRRTFQILVATTKEMGFGKDGKLPWKLPSDVKFFKEITSSTSAPSRKNTLIMGRKTWESIADQF